MAFNNASNVSMGDLRRIVDGQANSSTKSTSQSSLRATLANASSGSVSLWDSFKAGSRDITFNPSNAGNAYTLSDDQTFTATMSYPSSGTYFQSRVMTPNSSSLQSMWDATRDSGDDSISYGTKTSTQFTFTISPAGTSTTDFWTVEQIVPSSTAFERFYCNTTGGNTIHSEQMTIYDTSGGGGGGGF